MYMYKEALNVRLHPRPVCFGSRMFCLLNGMVVALCCVTSFFFKRENNGVEGDGMVSVLYIITISF